LHFFGAPVFADEARGESFPPCENDWCPATRRLDCAAQNFYRGSLRKAFTSDGFCRQRESELDGVTNLLHGQA